MALAKEEGLTLTLRFDTDEVHREGAAPFIDGKKKDLQNRASLRKTLIRFRGFKRKMAPQ